MKKEIKRTIHTQGLTLRAHEGEGESRTIEGYAILFDSPSVSFGTDDKGRDIREVISREAITEELLEKSDIKLTLYHDNGRLLGRSKQGRGTLKYSIDERGVKFEAEMPRTQHGDEALELVRSGIVDGCSFAFTTYYGDSNFVACECKEDGGKKSRVYTVKQITGLYDFTLTPDPAYPATSVDLRDILNAQREDTSERWRASVAAIERELRETNDI